MNDEDFCRYFIPGPTWVRPEILQEMTHPMISHRSGEFRELMRRIIPNLKTLFQTKQRAFIATSSGTGLLEGSLLNTVPRRVLVTTCGAFSERWLAIAEQLGVEVDHLSVPWGQAIDPDLLATRFTGRRYHYDAVTITHSETSTGVINDLKALAEVVRNESRDTLILVDAVSSLASAPVLFDEWGLDVCLASTQKGVAMPPGLTLFAVSDRALQAAEKKPYRGTYFDFLEYDKQTSNDGSVFTPSIPHYYALDRQLDAIVNQETLEKRWERHSQMQRMTVKKLEGIADLAAPAAHASPSVSALLPKHKSAEAVLAEMRARGYTLGSGYGQWKQDTFRIGHMGDITVPSLEAMLDVLREVAA